MNPMQGPTIASRCRLILLRKPLIMFGLPAVVYTVCHVGGLLIGLKPPVAPVMDGVFTVTPGDGGPLPWLVWLIFIGVATTAIIGLQTLASARALADAPLLPKDDLPSTWRAASTFLLLGLFFSIPLLMILSAPAYWLMITTTFSGSPTEDIRPMGLLLLMPLTAIGLIATPLIGARSVLATTVAVFERTGPRESLKRSSLLSRFVKPYPPLFTLGGAMVVTGAIMIGIATLIPVAFAWKFAIGMTLFLAVFEPLHVALVAVLFADARDKEARAFGPS